jgi:uncharacterized protein
VSGLHQVQAVLGGPALVALLAAMGVVAGIFAGLFGVGGAFLLNPVMIVLLGMDESVVVGSGLAFIIGTSAAGIARHMRSGNVELRGVFTLGAGAVGGAAMGTLSHNFLRAALGASQFGVLVRRLYIALLLVAAWLVFRPGVPHSSGRSLMQRLPLPPRIDLPAAGVAGVSAPGLVMLGVAIGLVTGMLGIGGGVLFVPLLMLGVGFTAHQAVGTSLGVVLMASMSGAASHSLAGHVSLWVAMSLLVGSTLGVQVGAWICHRLHAEKLRRYFAMVLLLAAAMVVVDLAFPRAKRQAAASQPAAARSLP